MTNNTNTMQEIRDALYTVLSGLTTSEHTLAGASKYHPVGPDTYPHASVEPASSSFDWLTNKETLRPYVFDVIVQYAVPKSETDGKAPMEYAWDNAMTALDEVLNAIDTQTNLGLDGVVNVLAPRITPGKAQVGDGLVVFFLIEVAVWTVFDKISM